MAIVNGRERSYNTKTYNGREWKNKTAKDTHISSGSFSPSLQTQAGRRPKLRRDR